jgi:hypothetical protein
MLGVPPQELWEKIPGVTQTDVERWKLAAHEGDAIARMNDIIGKQMSPQLSPVAAPPEPTAPTPATAA